MNNYYYLIFLLSTMSLFSMDQQNNNKNILQTKIKFRDYSDDLSEYFKAEKSGDKAKINAVLQRMYQNYTEDYTEFKIRKKNNGDEAPGYDELY